MKSISKLKKELDKFFSLFIRLRDATDHEGLCQCITCGKVSHYKKGIQNGHFQSRRFMATRYEEQNCSSQCIACNLYRGGEQYRFALAIDSKYGEGTAQELEFLAKTSIKKIRVEYEEDIRYYKTLVNNLKKEKGIE